MRFFLCADFVSTIRPLVRLLLTLYNRMSDSRARSGVGKQQEFINV